MNAEKTGGSQAELNHHLGRIEELTESNGRAGVRLHNAIWKDQAGRPSALDSFGFNEYLGLSENRVYSQL
jgi:hypothetical protein